MSTVSPGLTWRRSERRPPMAHLSRSKVGRSLTLAMLIWALAATPQAAKSQFAPPGARPWSDNSPLVSKITFSRDGKLGALVYRHGVTVLDLENWREKCLIHAEGVTALAFTHDGAELAIAAKDANANSPIGEPSRSVEIQIVDVRTGAVKKKVPDVRVTNVMEMAFTSAGTLFAVVTNTDPVLAGRYYLPQLDGLFLWDVVAGKLTPLLTGDQAPTVMYRLAEFTPDGEAFVLSLGNGRKDEIWMYSTAAPSVAHKIAGLADYWGSPFSIAALAFSDDGRMLAYCASQFGRAGRGIGADVIGIYDLAKRKDVRRIQNFPANGMSLVFLANGRLAAIPSIPSQARMQLSDFPSAMPAQGMQALRAVTIWNPANGKVEQRMDLPSDTTVNLLLPKQNALASMAGGTWSFRDLQSAEVKASIAAAGPQCLPAGAALLNQEMQKARQSFSIHRILAVSFFPGEPGVLMGVNADGVAYFWNMATGNELRRDRFASFEDCIAISENGRTVAVAGGDGNSVFALEDNGSLRRIPSTGLDRRAGALAASPGGEMLAFGETDGTIVIWDVTKRAVVRQWKGHGGAVRSLAFSRDGTMLASSANDMTVNLWSVGTGASVQSLEARKKKVNAVTFAAGPNALLASGGDDSKVILWDVRNRKSVRTLDGHRGPVRSISFSPDGSILISGADDGLIVWDVKTGKRIKVLLGNSAEWPGGRGATIGKPAVPGGNYITIMSIRFSTDGKLVACGGTNNTAMVWDTKTWGKRVFKPIEK